MSNIQAAIISIICMAVIALSIAYSPADYPYSEPAQTRMEAKR